MAVRDTSLRLTYEDFALFPDDGRRHELIDGEHFVTPAPSNPHQTASINLSYLFVSFLRAHPLGRVFAAPFDVVLSDVDVVEPDLLFIAAEHLDRLTEKNLQGSPDLVVEITSESTRRTDAVVKRKLYERFGVPEYWLLDPLLETARVYRLAEGGYGRAEELAAEEGGVLSTPLLPGLALPLAEIFRSSP